MASSEFRRVSDLFRGYLASDIKKEDIRSELEGVDEETLEKLSRKFLRRDLGSFFRWQGVLPERVFEDKELRKYVIQEAAAYFYLGCFYHGVSLDELGGEALSLYKKGEEQVGSSKKSFYEGEGGASVERKEDFPNSSSGLEAGALF